MKPNPLSAAARDRARRRRGHSCPVQTIPLVLLRAILSPISLTRREARPESTNVFLAEDIDTQ
jgi:hypothetical protein